MRHGWTRRRFDERRQGSNWLLGVAASAAFLGVGALVGAQAEGEETREEAQAAKPDPRLGAETDRICFGRNINGWKAVDGEDNVVLLERGVNEWHRVELTGACTERVFRFARAIGIESRPAGGCVSRGDVILVEDTPGFTQRCFISRIYEWDDEAPAPDEEDGDGENGDAG